MVIDLRSSNCTTTHRVGYARRLFDMCCMGMDHFFTLFQLRNMVWDSCRASWGTIWVGMIDQGVGGSCVLTIDKLVEWELLLCQSKLQIVLAERILALILIDDVLECLCHVLLLEVLGIDLTLQFRLITRPTCPYFFLGVRLSWASLDLFHRHTLHVLLLLHGSLILNSVVIALAIESGSLEGVCYEALVEWATVRTLTLLCLCIPNEFMEVLILLLLLRKLWARLGTMLLLLDILSSRLWGNQLGGVVRWRALGLDLVAGCPMSVRLVGGLWGWFLGLSGVIAYTTTDFTRWWNWSHLDHLAPIGIHLLLLRLEHILFVVGIGSCMLGKVPLGCNLRVGELSWWLILPYSVFAILCSIARVYSAIHGVCIRVSLQWMSTCVVPSITTLTCLTLLSWYRA